MCEFTSFASQLMNYFRRGESVEEVFPEWVFGYFDIHEAEQGLCMACKEPMAHMETDPPGRCTRSMHGGCFHRLIASHVNYTCIICGRPLPPDKVQTQMANPREMRANMHEGECLLYYALHHSIVVGAVNQDIIYGNSHCQGYPAQYSPQHEYYNEPGYPAIDAEYGDYGHQGGLHVSRSQPMSSRKPRVGRVPSQLPPPPKKIAYQPMDTVDSLFGSSMGQQEDDVEIVYLPARRRR